MTDQSNEKSTKSPPVTDSLDLSFTYSDDVSSATSPRRRPLDMLHHRTIYSDDIDEEQQLLEADDEGTFSFSSHSSASELSNTQVLMNVDGDADMSHDNLLDETHSYAHANFSRNEQQQQAELESPRAMFAMKNQLSVTTDYLFDSSPVSKSGSVPLRRVVSSPLSIRSSKISPTNRLTPIQGGRPPRAEMTNITSIPPSGSKGDLTRQSPLAVPYSLSRQMSLPVTSDERLPLSIQRPRVNTTDLENSYGGNYAESNFGKQSPSSARSSPQGSIFRTVTTPTHTLRSRPNTPQNEIPRSPTFRTNILQTSDNDVEMDALDVLRETQQMEMSIIRRRLTVEETSMAESTTSSSTREKQFWQRKNTQYIAYLSTFAIFGSLFRLFTERLFGLDCEYPDLVRDHWMPIYKHVCVTASGMTLQSGGALFTSLPANMVGSAIIGVMTNLRPDLWPPLPWFGENHPLQQYEPLHVAIKTGFCGSLTTFSSWNTQMVIMMDGSTTVLGTQIISAIFGYLLGLISAIGCFIFGTQVAVWMNRYRYPHVAHEMDGTIDITSAVNMVEEGEAPKNEIERKDCDRVVFPAFVRSNQCCRLFTSILSAKNIPFLAVIGIFVSLTVSDAVMNAPYYRSLWLSILLTPPGALLRWQLSRWNGRWSFMGRFKWVPWGTFLCNVIASLVALLCTAIEHRFYKVESSASIWPVTILGAVRSGFAGSLSSVSALVKEFVDLNNSHKYHAKCYFYVVGTIFVSASLGLLVFSPIVRI